ncbi:hypothetical protein F5X68DRAFT_24555 [Plectosphaerella plurivora]|uniref:Uncharacterized protein n=1 Tax=Plectosphaerella plurivora TaxID=936078 RepID=A0A9P9AAC7_9PEZI|nr:hypothetical protein F5X68DRAFT_24555 [Plectosphaerella plurivora]
MRHMPWNAAFVACAGAETVVDLSSTQEDESLSQTFEMAGMYDQNSEDMQLPGGQWDKGQDSVRGKSGGSEKGGEEKG